MIIFFVMKAQKILTCDANGSLCVSPRFFDCFYEEILDEIYETKDKMARMYKFLHFADSCRKDKCVGYDLELYAYNAYVSVFRSLSWKCTGEEKELLELAASGLSSLSMSDNEYIWEIASQTVSDYHFWKREQERIENEMLEAN